MSPPPPKDEPEEKTEDVAPTEAPMNMDTSSNGADAKSLEEENLKLKEQRLCKICMDEEVNIVLLPCGHLVSCVKCAPALRNCPICRNGIKGTVRTFMAWKILWTLFSPLPPRSHSVIIIIHGRIIAWWGAQSFSNPPPFNQFGWMKLPFECYFEWLRGTCMASSEGILRLYLEPRNLLALHHLSCINVCSYLI